MIRDSIKNEEMRMTDKLSVPNRATTLFGGNAAATRKMSRKTAFAGNLTMAELKGPVTICRAAPATITASTIVSSVI
ncbi:MAG: hypothetical protein A2X18_06130 [Bacteroidetes bacterium GWF2_40_14]|nr:MAG: hypothetical protein A2X18_06130 [Bacteroidetes bacterium GWF2_40_14]